jgi:hypothetical protein
MVQARVKKDQSFNEENNDGDDPGNVLYEFDEQEDRPRRLGRTPLKSAITRARDASILNTRQEAGCHRSGARSRSDQSAPAARVTLQPRPPPAPATTW